MNVKHSNYFINFPQRFIEILFFYLPKHATDLLPITTEPWKTPGFFSRLSDICPDLIAAFQFLMFFLRHA